MKTISKKTRDEAIEALLCCASDRVVNRHTCTDDIVTGPTDYVANMAWLETYRVLSGGDIEDAYLEAAALLRDGWSPGDPVVRRGGGS